MTRLRFRGLVLALIATTVAGCDSNGGVSRPPPTSIVVINTAPSYSNLAFLREAREVATLPFATGTADSFDSGPYDFNVDATFSSGARTRLATMAEDLAPNTRYVFVLSESATGFSPFVFEAPITAQTGTNAETTIVHAAAAAGSFDVYLEPQGTDLLTATPLGNLAYRGHLPAATRNEGTYRVYLTAPGDATAVRFESTTFTLPAGTSSIITIKDEGGVGIGTLDFILFGTQSVSIPDTNAQAGLRFVNAIADMTARDFAIDAAYTPPAFSNVAFGTVTDYTELNTGFHDVSVTPVGNPVDELTSPVDLAPGRVYTVLVSGNTSEGLRRITLLDELRPRIGESSIRVMNGASSLSPIQFYLTAPGVDINLAFPLAVLSAPSGSERFNYPPGDYELTLRDSSTLAIVAGPTALTLEDGGRYELLAVDAVGGSTADIVYLGDFN